MQYTPNEPLTHKWVIQFEVQGAWKSKSMGWMFSDDIYSHQNIDFDSLEKAIAFCKKHGAAYQIEVPRTRNPSFKSYAHNFLWKGEPEVDSEDIEE